MSSSENAPGSLDAWTIVEPFANVLIPVPAAQDGVCSICKSSARSGFGTCYRCHEAAQILGPLPDVVPISWSPHTEQLHTMLQGYKRGSPSERASNTLKLAALLGTYLRHHSGCLGEFDVVTTVPSVRGDAPKAIVERLRTIRDQHVQLLAATRSTDRRPGLDLFRVQQRVDGVRVLLVDDTFASGASLLSAAATLREAGADMVGPVVIGRHINRGWQDTAAVLEWLGGRTWNRARCVRCDGERSEPGSLFDF